MLRKSNISLSNRALFYPNQKNMLLRHEELQDSNVAKKDLSKRETANSSFLNLPKSCSGERRNFHGAEVRRNRVPVTSFGGLKFRYPKMRVWSQTFEDAGQSNKSNETTVKRSLFSEVRSSWTCLCDAEAKRGLKAKVLPDQSSGNPFWFNTQIKSNQQNKFYLRRPLSKRCFTTSLVCFANPRTNLVDALVSRPFGPTGLRSAFVNPKRCFETSFICFGNPRGSDGTSLVAKANPRPAEGRRFGWPSTNPRNISIQWLEKVGFTFSPFAFIFGTTLLFAALASTLQKQAGKQWLQTLSHTKLPGLTENKISQTSSWVFLESVLSQYINRNNSLLVSTTYFSQDGPYSSKLWKARPRTLGPFMAQPKAEHRQPRLPKKGIQIQLSPLWSQHLKKDFLGVFPLCRTNSANLNFRSLSLSESATAGTPKVSEAKVTAQPVLAPELKRTLTWPWFKITAYYPPNRFVVPTWNYYTTTQANGPLDLILVKPAITKTNLQFVNGAVEYAPEKISQAESAILTQINFNPTSRSSEAQKSAFITPVEGGVAKEPITLRGKANNGLRRRPDQIEGLLTTAVEHPVKKSDINSSTPLFKMLRELELLALHSRASSWLFGSASNDQASFGSVNTGVQRLRLEDDSIPSKKASIYSKKKIHQDAISARVLNVVKKGFYNYGLSIPHFRQAKVGAVHPPTLVATKTQVSRTLAKVEVELPLADLAERVGNKTHRARVFGSVPKNTPTKPEVAKRTRASLEELGLIFKTIAIPKKSLWEYAHYISGYNFPELQDHEVADLFRSKRRFGGPQRRLKVSACLQSKVGTIFAKQNSAKLSGRGAPRGATLLSEVSQTFGLPDKLSQSESYSRKLRPSKAGKAVKLGVTPPVNSWFCKAMNQVLLTPYSIKVPPKVLMAVSNKTESICPLKNAPLALSLGESERSESVSEPSEHEIGSDLTIKYMPGQSRCSATQSKQLLLRSANSPAEQEVYNPGISNFSEDSVFDSTGRTRASLELPKHTFSKASTAQVEDAAALRSRASQREQLIVKGFTLRYTPLDLKQENRVKKAFKKLGRDYSDYLKQPKDSLPALLLSPSLEEDKQIEEEEFQRLAQEKAAAKADANRTQDEEEYNGSYSATVEEEFNSLDPLEVSLKEVKNNVSNLEEEPINDEEIEDSRFERLRFTRELETKKEEEDCRGLALALTRRGLNESMGNLEEVGQSDLLVKRARTELSSEPPSGVPGTGRTLRRGPFQPATRTLASLELELMVRSDNFVRGRNNISGFVLFKPVPRLLPSKAEYEPDLCLTKRPSIAQFAAKKLEPKVSDRKHSFFGQRSFWPTRLFSQEERLISAHIVNPYIRYDQRNPWLIFEQGGLLLAPKRDNRNSVPAENYPSVRASRANSVCQTNQTDNFPAFDSASSSAKLNTSTDSCLEPKGTSKPRAVNSLERSSGPLATLHTKNCKSEDLQNLKNLQTQARLGLIRFVHFPVVEAASVTDKAVHQNRIHKSDPRLRLTPLESSASADWRNDRKVEASPFRVSSKDRVHIVLPKLSENQWQKSIEWQLKRHFLDEDTRIESLVSTEPFKTFKVKKIERSLPWLTLAGPDRASSQFRLANSSFANSSETRGRVTDGSSSFDRVRFTTSEEPKKAFFKPFQWPYKTVGVVGSYGTVLGPEKPKQDLWSANFRVLSFAEQAKVTPIDLSDRGSVLAPLRVNRNRLLARSGPACSALLSTSTPLSPFRLLNYSRIPLASNFTTYSKDSSALSISSNPLIDITNKLFSNQSDLSTELIFEVPATSSWFLIYRLFLALILKEIFKYIYRISLKDFFIRILNSDFGRTITSPEFRHSIQFEPFPEFYKPKNRLKDIIGIKNALLPLSEIIWFLRNKCRSRNGPHGVILLGPEGVDTTAIAQAVAGEAKVPIIVQSLRALILTHSHPQKRLEKVLLLARAQSPCVLFLDELDVIGQSREGVVRKTSGVENSLISLDSSNLLEGSTQPQPLDEQATSQGRRVDLMLRLLTVMDGLHHLNGVVIITTSKNTATLDPALLRPGRFDRLIHLTLPNHDQRVELFKAKTRGLTFAKRKCGHTDNLTLNERSSLLSVDELEYLSIQTANMSGADIVSAINYSTLRAIVNDTIHTVETLEYGLNCVKALKDKQIAGTKFR